MAETHEALLRQLITRMETEELGFYRSHANFHYYAWHIAAAIPFLSSVITAAVAGLMDVVDMFKTSGRVMLVVLPVMGTIASGFLYLYKFREKEALREEGRIELEDLIAVAKSLMASARNEEEYAAAFHRVRERFRHLELTQHRQDTLLRSDKLPKTGVPAGAPAAAE